MSEFDEKVFCEKHGEAIMTFVCQHLPKGSDLGFYFSFDPENPDNPYPDAWCGKCDEMLERTGEWNEESEAFAGITLICSNCYEEARKRHQI